MTDHPIAPPPKLVQQWWAEIWHEGTPRFKLHCDEHIATRAAQWGADQELEACINYFHEYDPSWGRTSELITGLRVARRPQPPSLKEEALLLLDEFSDPEGLYLDVKSHNTIRRALEQLDD